MTFTSKKEADAYDKMLDVADNLSEFIEESKIVEDKEQLEQLAFYLAQERDTLARLLKGGPVKKVASKPAKKADVAAIKTAANQ
ncbi:hypothetical protein GCM10007894_26110 [Paraferrimonas haliotis]|uniref:Multidrug DMT transporter permease n=2 Tax=Paraferrimonas haliotis TaxID=2013866 RepID=A0AA37WYN1_9GAMM|nr:hypothetical protein GCM10007894_26110 [Paraferrimonas haliotis]